MKRTLELLRFELGLYRKRISTVAYWLVMAALGFFLMNIFGGAFPGVTASFGGSDGNVLLNSPHILMLITSMFGLFGTLVVAAISGNAGYRDFGEKMHPLVFVTTTSKMQYVASRYVGALIVSVLTMTGVGVGLWLATMMPWLDADRFGPQSLAAYLRPYLLIIIPNVVFASAIFFSLALLTRQRMPHYLGGVGLLLGYMVANVLVGDLETKWIAALVDPFGINAVGLVTEYWTTIEKNQQLLGLEGWLMVNRLVWVGIALAIVGFAYSRFKLVQAGGWTPRRKGKDELSSDAATMPAVPVTIDIPNARRTRGFAADLAQLRVLTTRGFQEVIMSPSFAAILLAGILFLLLSAVQLETIFGTPTWPMAWKVIEVLGGSFSLFVMILLTIYSGELVWRERDLKLDQVVDSTPARSWVSFVSKLAALSGVVLLLLGVVVLAGMLAQAFAGFFRFEPALYAQKLFGMQLVDYLLLAILALAVHTLVNHKYTGHFLLIFFFVGIDLAPLLGLEHSLWRYGSDLGETYSDMNRHGWFLGPFFWLKLYWGGFALLLAALSNLLWPRGVDGRIRSRLQNARLRLRTALVAVGALGGALALGAGGFVFYNTNVLNDFRSSSEVEAQRAEWEKSFKQYEARPQPRVVDVSVQVDIFPQTGDLEVSGRYEFVNKTDGPIDEIHVLLSSEPAAVELELGGGAASARLELEDKVFGYRIYELGQPLAAGATGTLDFELSYPRSGFAHSIQNRVVDNGSFVNSSVLPSFGYDENRELVLDRERKKYGLEPKERIADLDDPQGIRNNYISRDADFVMFEATISTDTDQIALAPGYLEREWEENGRRYFHYAMDAPFLNFFSFLSARYVVVRNSWEDVAIEVYHHPGHDFNVQRMIDATKKSLEYFSREFSPYQHRQLRILEFPRYASFAQSFPNTVPYSEAIGFIARVGDDDIDYPFYVTAHEVAHQWWAHQVIGGKVQGATVLSETLSQYSALMVMEKEYGAAKIRDFLEYELDNYLQGRSGELKKEVSLLRVENQPYIHYNKGSLIMYAVRDAIGEEAVNRALSNLVDQWAFKGPPYPTSRSLVEALVAETPDDLKRWVNDLFEFIVLYENRAVSAVAQKSGDSWEVTLDLRSRKVRSGELGEETEMTLDDPIDVGIFDAEGEPIYFEKHRFTKDSEQLVVTVDREPARAGIDPYRKLIDRHPDDNEVRVEIQ